MIVLKHRRSTARSIWLYSLLLVLTGGGLPTGAGKTYAATLESRFEFKTDRMILKTPASYDIRKAEWWAELDKKKFFGGPDTQELLALWLDVPILERQIIFSEEEVISYTFTKQDLIGLYNDIHYQTTLDTAKQR